MDITRIAPRDRQHIQRYGADGFRVSDQTFEGPVIVFADGSVPWDAPAVAELSVSDFSQVAHKLETVDLCLLGCGARTLQVPKDLRDAMREKGVSVEPMDTGAACRTFNVLLAEGRAVMAALLLPEDQAQQ